MWKYRKFSWQF